jgi:hypothetical protein
VRCEKSGGRELEELAEFLVVAGAVAGETDLAHPLLVANDEGTADGA